MPMQLANHHPDRELEQEQVEEATAQIIESLRISLGDKLGRDHSLADLAIEKFGQVHLERAIRNAARNIVAGLL